MKKNKFKKSEVVINEFMIGQRVISHLHDGKVATVTAIFKPLTDDKIAYSIEVKGIEGSPSVKADALFSDKNVYNEFLLKKDHEQYLILKEKFGNK